MKKNIFAIILISIFNLYCAHPGINQVTLKNNTKKMYTLAAYDNAGNTIKAKALRAGHSVKFPSHINKIKVLTPVSNIIMRGGPANIQGGPAKNITEMTKCKLKNGTEINLSENQQYSKIIVNENNGSFSCSFE